MRVKLVRYYQDQYFTRGVIHDEKAAIVCHTLELPWRGNAVNTSRIPAGEYPVKRDWSSNLGAVWRLYDVPNRDSILLHVGNSTSDIRGCILVGLDSYGCRVLNSRQAMQRLRALGDCFILEVKDGFSC